MTHILCQNANFENGGTTIQMGTACTVEYFVNILTVQGTRQVWLFRDAKRILVLLFYILKNVS